MDFSKVKSMTIPEGEVALLYIDGKTVWRKAVEQLATPTISLNGDILTITTTDERTEEFVIFVDGVEMATVFNIITFTIDGTPYQAVEGMTWRQWVGSSYNTGGFYEASGYEIWDAVGYIQSGNTKVEANGIIIHNVPYTIRNMQGGDSND